MTERRDVQLPDLPEELLVQLLELIDSLRAESAAYLDEPGDQQLWYNRGYANGMVLALLRLGLADRLGPRMPDDLDALQAHLTMAWGKAYRHGERLGSDETHEITGTRPP